MCLKHCPIHLFILSSFRVLIVLPFFSPQLCKGNLRAGDCKESGHWGNNSSEHSRRQTTKVCQPIGAAHHEENQGIQQVSACGSEGKFDFQFKGAFLKSLAMLKFMSEKLAKNRVFSLQTFFILLHIVIFLSCLYLGEGKTIIWTWDEWINVVMQATFGCNCSMDSESISVTFFSKKIYFAVHCPLSLF